MESRDSFQRNVLPERKGKTVLERQTQLEDLENKLKVIAWEDFENSLAHLCGTTTVLARAELQKEALSQKLEALLAARSKLIQAVDKLEVLKKEVELRKQRLEHVKLTLQKNVKEVAKKRELLLPLAQSLLFSSQALVSADGRIQEAERLLNGEGGYTRLVHLSKLRIIRCRFMVAQVAALYPLAWCNCSGVQATKPACSSRLPLGDFPGKHIPDAGSSSRKVPSQLSIAGLHILTPNIKAPSLFGNNQNQEGTATALGYVAHIVFLLAIYLDVPLRYPIKFGASRSYVQDFSPAIDRRVNAGLTTGILSYGGDSLSTVEFPLFSEGQDSTRSAYAIFLLNKDMEQLLNLLGAEIVGPRHTLPNLHRLLSTIYSGVNLV